MIVRVIVSSLIMLGVVGGLIAFIRWVVKQSKKSVVSGPLNDELTKLFGEPSKWGIYGAREILHGGIKGSVVLVPGGKNSPPTLRLDLPIEVRVAGAKIEHGAYRETARRRVFGKLPILFRKETSTDRFGKRIGLNVETETGDAVFDDEVYVETDARRDDVEALLSDATTRQAILQLLRMGVTSVEMFRGASSLRAQAVRPTAEVVRSTPKIVELLGVIADNLPAFESSPAGRSGPLGPAIVAVASMLGAFLAFVFGMLAGSKFQILQPGAVLSCVGVGLGVWVAACVLTFVLVRGRSDALRTFAFVFFSGVFAFPSATVGVAATANALLDQSKVTSHEVRIRRRWITTSKNNKTYHLEVESWRKDQETFEVTVPANLYGAVYESGHLRVDTGEGRFGWEWIVRVQRVQHETTPPPLPGTPP